MKVRLTTLTENTTARPALLAELGLSVMIEAGSSVILLDAGQTVSAAHNAGILGADLTRVEKIVLSHGHFDHTGGLRDLLPKVGKTVEVVCHPDVWAAKYDVRAGHPPLFVGIPFTLPALESLGARFNMSRAPVVLGDHIMTTGEVPMVTNFETIDPHLFVKDGAGFRPDPVLDDQAIVMESGDGLAVLLGCAHRGMINTLYYAQKLTGKSKINLVLGGSHLVGAGEERIWKTIAALKELGVERLGLCHCTGLPAASEIAREFRDAFFFCNAGNRIEIETGP